MTTHLNLAQAYIKISGWCKAVENADKALKCDPKNAKGLYRRALAHSNWQNYDKALESLEEYQINMIWMFKL